jgi:hypothetical protein
MDAIIAGVGCVFGRPVSIALNTSFEGGAPNNCRANTAGLP